jgi:DNA-binding PadR family transcriptional regulator
VLKEAGLVTDRKEGTRRLYQLNPQGIALLRAHFDQLWDQALTAFQTAAEKPPATKKEATKKEKEKSRARTRKRSSRT